MLIWGSWKMVDAQNAGSEKGGAWRFWDGGLDLRIIAILMSAPFALFEGVHWHTAGPLPVRKGIRPFLFDLALGAKV